jgi:hypothetical protein
VLVRIGMTVDIGGLLVLRARDKSMIAWLKSGFLLKKLLD